MDKITFENATLVNPAKVTIDNVDYNVTPEQTTGGTALSAGTFNQMQSNIEKSVVAISSTEPSTNEKVWIKKGKNLFNKNAVLKNCELLNDGANVGYNVLWFVSDYIEVEPNTTYYLSGNRTDGTTNAFYDENKTFISYVSKITGDITTPLNAKYIRFNGKLSEIDNNIMLEQNSTATSYEAYVDKEILVKNNNGVFEKIYSEQQKDKSSVLLYTGGISNTTDTLTYSGNISNYDKLIIQLGSNLEGDSKIIEIDSQGNVINVSAYLNAFVSNSYNCSASILASNNEVQIKGRQLSGWSTVPIRIFGVTR